MARKAVHFRPYKVEKPKSVVVHSEHRPAMMQVVSVPDKEAALSEEDKADLEAMFMRLSKKAGKYGFTVC